MTFRKAIYILTTCLTLVMLSGCGSKHRDEPDPQPDPFVGTRTVLVYMVADNTMSGFVTSDINEMKVGFADAGINASKSNLLVYVDSYSTNPTIYRLKRDATGTVTDEIIYEYPTDHDSASPEIIKDVISKVKSECPAEKYGFIYWSHGDGWVPYPLPTKSLKPMAGTEMKWIGIDVTRTSIPDLSSVLTAFGSKLDFLMLDACFMLSVETIYQLQNVAESVISSPTEIPGPGAPYDAIVPKMFGSNAASNIVGSYYNYYAATYDENAQNTNTNWTGGVSIGYVKTAALENLAKATKKALANHKSFSLDALKKSVLNYDKRSVASSSYIGYYDLYGVMENLLPTADFTTWKTAFSAAVFDFKTTPKNYSSFAGLFSMEGAKGLSAFLPITEDSSSGMDVEYQRTAWYKDAGLSQLGW